MLGIDQLQQPVGVGFPAEVPPCAKARRSRSSGRVRNASARICRTIPAASPSGTEQPASYSRSRSGTPPLSSNATQGTPADMASSTTLGNGSSREVSRNTGIM